MKPFLEIVGGKAPGHWAAVGAMAEDVCLLHALEQMLHLLGCQALAGLDCGLAGHGGQYRLHPLTGAATPLLAQLGKDRGHHLFRWRGAHDGGHGLDHETVAAELFHFKPEPRQFRAVLFENLAFLERAFQHLGKEEPLAGHIIRAVALAQFLEEQSFVGRVLVYHQKATLALAEEIALRHLTE